MQFVVNIVALKKPSQYFKKDTASVDESILENSSPTQLNTFSDAFDSFKKNLNKIEVLSEFSDTLDNYRINVERVNHLSEKVEGIQQDIQSLLKKEDLDRAMMSQLIVVEQSIRDVQSKVKSINENKLTEIRLDVSSLTNSVSEFLEVEVPKYKKLIVDSELRTNNRYEELENDVNKTLEGIGEFVESKYQHLTETLKDINQQSLASILEDFRILDENFSKLKEEDIPRYKGFIVETERKTENKLEEINSQVLESLSSFEEKIDINIEKNHSEISNIVESLEKKIVKFENKDLPKYKKIIVESEKKTEEKLNDFNAVLEKTVNSLMEKISLVEGNKVDLIKTVNDKIQEVVSLRDLVVDELEKNESSRDDLKKKVTDLEIEIVRNESHIQVQNKNLEKIQEEVFSAIRSINLEEIEEKSYDLSKKIKYLEEVFEKFNEKEILNENIIVDPPSTENKDPITPLDKNFVTIEQLQQHYRLFINRIQQQLATIGGGGETRLKYLDDIVGIATNPSAYDGKFLKYNDSIGKFEFSDPTAIPAGVAEENIIYVAKDGNDSNNGTLTEPKLTIKSAVESIGSGITDVVIRVAPGTYIEDNPISLPDEVTIIGHSLRETTVIPQNDDEDLFYVGNGNYIAEMSFRGSLINKAVISFDPEKPRYITQSPYVQNCTNFIPDSIGLRVDGNAVIGPIKSMVLDSYTQYNQGGIGASITNQGYAQLVSLFTICDDIAVYCGSGGGCDLTNSNSSFGNYGLVADGVSPKKYSGIITSPSTSLSNTFVVDLSVPELSVSYAVYDNVSGMVTITTSSDHNFNVGMGVSIVGLGFTCSSGPTTLIYPNGNKGYTFNINQVNSSNEFSVYVGVSTLQHTYVSGGTVKTEVVRPYDGQVIYFNDLYDTVKTITITDGGSGYTSPPIVTIDDPSASWGIRAKAIATIKNGSVTQIDMLSNGRGYSTIPSITFSPPQSGINTALGVAVMSPEYYTIESSTQISSGISTITLNENIPFAVGIGTTVNFFKQSRILAAGHSFEFIGSGTDIANSIPFNGGSPPIPENEIDSRNGGLVVYTSTNQSGNFKIGDGVTINQNTGSITGRAYEKSLISTMTPYILSLGAL